MALGWKGQYFRYREFFLNIYTVYKTKPDVRMFLEILLSLVTVSLFAAFALKPTLLTISGLLVETKAKEEVLQKLDQKITALAGARTAFDRETQRIPLALTAVPNQAAADILVFQLQAASRAHSLTTIGISTGEITLVGEELKQKKNEGVTPLPDNASGIDFSISVSGNYQDLISFMGSLESLRIPIYFDTISLSSSKNDGGKFLILVISGRTPYLGVM